MITAITLYILDNIKTSEKEKKGEDKIFEAIIYLMICVLCLSLSIGMDNAIINFLNK